MAESAGSDLLTPLHINDMVSPAQVLAKAADALSAGDLVNRKVRQYGSWGLMPFAAAIGSVYPASYMRGVRETYHPMENNFPRSAWALTYTCMSSLM